MAKITDTMREQSEPLWEASLTIPSSSSFQADPFPNKHFVITSNKIVIICRILPRFTAKLPIKWTIRTSKNFFTQEPRASMTAKRKFELNFSKS